MTDRTSEDVVMDGKPAVFVLIAESGEYEQFTSEVRGVFTSMDGAEEAIRQMQKISEETWAEYQAAEDKRKAWMAANCVDINKSGDGRSLCSYPLYRQKDYDAAREALGASPNFWTHTGVAYRILEATLDANHPTSEPREIVTVDKTET